MLATNLSMTYVTTTRKTVPAIYHDIVQCPCQVLACEFEIFIFVVYVIASRKSSPAVTRNACHRVNRQDAKYRSPYAFTFCVAYCYYNIYVKLIDANGPSVVINLNQICYISLSGCV